MADKRNSQSRLTRRQILKSGLYGGLAASGIGSSLCLSGCGRGRRAKGPNVLIVLVDTLRADHVSCYGYKKAITPNIDRLSQQGHRFSSAYTTIPTTLPAHASLFTSLYPTQFSSRRNGEKIPTDVVTLAEVLRSSGYTTAAFVSSIVMNARYNIDQGFETYDDVDRQISRPAAETLAKSITWLKRHSKKPFFLFMHLFDPHTPYYAPESYRRMLGAPDKPTPPGIEFSPAVSQLTPRLVEKITAAYDAEISYSDWAVGELMNELNRLGLDERTIVVFLSDHGESLGELIKPYGYGFDHGEFLYTHQLQIPMIMRLPGEGDFLRAEMVHKTSVSIIDIMPTVLEALQIEPPPSMEGESLLPMLHGEKRVHRRVFSERRSFEKAPKPYLAGEAYSIIEDQWHLIFSTSGDSELYNLLYDPREVSKLSDKGGKATILKAEVQQWLGRLKPLFGPPVFEADEKVIERLRSLGYVE